MALGTRREISCSNGGCDGNKRSMTLNSRSQFVCFVLGEMLVATSVIESDILELS
jgi:hypothetical protein